MTGHEATGCFNMILNRMREPVLEHQTFVEGKSVFQEILDVGVCQIVGPCALYGPDSSCRPIAIGGALYSCECISGYFQFKVYPT